MKNAETSSSIANFHAIVILGELMLFNEETDPSCAKSRKSRLTKDSMKLETQGNTEKGP